jgi:hypothetical protein
MPASQRGPVMAYPASQRDAVRHTGQPARPGGFGVTNRLRKRPGQGRKLLPALPEYLHVSDNGFLASVTGVTSRKGEISQFRFSGN